MKNKEKTPKRFISAPELAKRWGISDASAYRAAGTILPAMRVGGSVRIPLDAVESHEKAQLGRVPAESAAS